MKFNESSQVKKMVKKYFQCLLITDPNSRFIGVPIGSPNGIEPVTELMPSMCGRVFLGSLFDIIIDHELAYVDAVRRAVPHQWL